MILLDGLAAVIVLLALCRLVPDQAWRSVLYYYTISNYLMLFPYNRRPVSYTHLTLPTILRV